MNNSTEHEEQKTGTESALDQQQHVLPENATIEKETLQHEQDNTHENEKDEHGTNLSENQTVSDSKEIEIIDIDEFLIRTKECGLSQFAIVLGMMLVTFTLAYTPFIFYFIGFDPHWIDTENGTAHYREDNSRCFLNESQWRYDHEKTTVVTEVNKLFSFI